MQYTDNMELLLYEANDIMQTTDFVNRNNQKIDEFTAAVKTTAEEANASAAQANRGVSAADAKITQIQTSITQNELSSLPQFKRDTNDRLDTLEDDVNGLTGWKTFMTTPSGIVSNSVLKSSIGVSIGPRREDTAMWQNVTEIVKGFFGNAVTTAYTKKVLLGSAQGNIFNLSEVNTLFAIGTYSFDSDGTVHTSAVAVKWTGVVTELYDLSSSGTTNQYFMGNIYPFVKR